MRFLRYAREQTNRQTDRLIAIFRFHTGGGVKTQDSVHGNMSYNLNIERRTFLSDTSAAII